MRWIKSLGFTLIEILGAMMLSAAILIILFEVYLTTVKSYDLLNSLQNIKNNAQHALQILTTEASLAGYIGCAKLTDDFPIHSYQHHSITPTNQIKFDDVSMAVRHASVENVILLENMDTYDRLKVAANILFKVGDFLLISDCRQAEIFKIKKVGEWQGLQVLTTEQPLHHLYQEKAEVSFYENNRFFVEKGFLIMEDAVRNKFKLVSGMVGMQILGESQTIRLTFQDKKIIKTWFAHV